MYIDQTRACYRILNPFFGPDDTLYSVDQNGDPAIVYFDGEPNEEMEPMNKLAEERLSALMEKLDDLGRKAAEKVGRPFVARPRNIDGAIQLATEIQRANMSIMGTKKGDSGIERVESDQTPETGFNGQRRKRGRPPQNIPLSKAG